MKKHIAGVIAMIIAITKDAGVSMTAFLVGVCIGLAIWSSRCL